MKKTMKTVTVLILLCMVLTVGAFAANFTHCADALADLGLFQGTQNGYELDRAPTRPEAAAMLVRLLGAEEDAQALSYTAPFTDVADWAKPYVQYLYDNGLTNGKSATQFGSSDPCTAQQYAVFLLRALGYSDQEGGDFTYADALTFAEEIGLADEYNCNPLAFRRDDVVAMSYTALATAPKSGEADLLTKLVNEGAIADAKGYDRFFADYRRYIAACDFLSTEEAVSFQALFEVTESGTTESASAMKLFFAIDPDSETAKNNRMIYELSMSMHSDGLKTETTQPIGIYYRGGWAYTNFMGMKVKVKQETFDDTDILDLSVLSVSQASLLCTIKSIQINEIAKNSYTCDISYFGAPFGHGDEGTEFDMTEKIVVRNGKLVSSTSTQTISETYDGVTDTMVTSAEIKNVKYGSEVVFDFPSDLDSYAEAEEESVADDFDDDGLLG